MAQKWNRRGYELQTLFWGRPVRPFHLAVAIATSTVAISNLLFEGIVLQDNIGNIVGTVSLMASAFLVTGWWFGKEWLAEWGLILATGTFAARAAFSVLSVQAFNSFFLSIAWTVGAGGAYLLERYDNVTGKASE